MKKLFSLILTLAFILTLTACSEEEIPPYSLAFINSSDESVLDYANSIEGYTVVNLVNEKTAISEYLLAIEDLSVVENIIIFDDTIEDVLALEIMDILKPLDIPVSFAFASINDETLNSYDKAYNFSMNYTYLGELLAKKADELWSSGTIDSNSSLLLEFSSIGYSNQTDNEIELYTSFVRNIELLGIPYSILSEDYVDVVDHANVLLLENTTSELIVVLDNKLLNEVYPSYTNTIPLIAHNFSISNVYSDNTNILFTDYTNYFTTTLQLFENIENKTYPFENISLHLEGKTIYLSPVI